MNDVAVADDGLATLPSRFVVGKSCEETDGLIKVDAEPSAPSKEGDSGTTGNGCVETRSGADDVDRSHICDQAVGGLLTLALSFCLLFAGWIPMENLLSTFKAKLGYYALMIVYVAVVPGSFLAPWVMARCGVRCSMFFSAAPYTAFSAALLGMEKGICINGELLYLCAVGVGLGCGVLWGSMGVLVKQFSQAYDLSYMLQHLSQATFKEGSLQTDGSLGLFNGVGQSAPTVGGLIALFGSSVLAQLQISQRVLYTTFFFSLSFGNVLLLLVPNARALLAQRRCQLLEQRAACGLLEQQTKADTDGIEEAPQAVPALAIPQLLRRSRGLSLLQLCFLSGGYANAFMAGSFTADVIALSLGKEWIGYVMAVRNLAAVASGVGLGWLSDRIGRYRCYLLSLSCEGILAIFCCLASFPNAELSVAQSRLLIFALVIFMGVGNAGSQTLLRSMIGDMFETEVGTALSAGSLFSSLAQVCGYLAGPSLQFRRKAQLLFALWCTAGMGAALASRHQADTAAVICEVATAAGKDSQFAEYSTSQTA